MISLDSYAVPNPAVVGRIVEGEAVLVLPEQGQVKVLNEVGARIWVLADGARTLRQIAAALSDEYDVNQAQAKADVLDFVAQLAELGIASLARQPPQPPNTGGSRMVPPQDWGVRGAGSYPAPLVSTGVFL